MSASSAAALFSPAQAGSRRLSLQDRYCYLLCVVLIGYAVLGKGFAYLGVPPLFIGEIVLVVGLTIMVFSRCGIAFLASIPSVMLVLLMSWVVIRTIPFVETYGPMAARDSVVALYGLFAFIVITLLLEQPDRLPRLLAVYSRFAWFYAGAGIVVVNAMSLIGNVLPNWPGTAGIPLVYVRLGECASHLAAAAAFALLGLRRVSWGWVLVMLISLGMITVSRGAMMAAVVSLSVAAMATRYKKQLGLAVTVAVLLFGATYAADLNVPLGDGRDIGPRQIVNGLGSIVGHSNEVSLDGTKKWRLAWWDTIVDYTIHGSYFWAGKGFGVNLAEDDGIVFGEPGGGPPLRSPHSVHMTVLARSGVIGLALWIATCVSWLVMLFNATVTARRRRDDKWADVFVWIACYGIAIVVDSSFDVALEGPMLGIWFWCIYGLGIGSVLLYRSSINGQPYRLSYPRHP